MTRDEIEAMARLEGMPVDAFTEETDDEDGEPAAAESAAQADQVDPKKRAIARRELENGYAVCVAARESGLDEDTVRRIRAELTEEANERARQQAEQGELKSYGGLALGVRSRRDKERVGL